ncbi:MAG: F0F1 ATP synthase subunit B [Gammaproteobacteria bacterium]|nr:F0F1 ATP synthase subunit B [Gammaproteobacteria bacterium]
MNINATLLVQMIVFLLLVIFMMKFVWPVIIQALDERRKKIVDGLAAAEKGAHEKELAEQRAKDLLKEAKTQAAEIIARAQKQGGDLVEEAKETARTEGDRIKTAAQADIQQEVNRAKETLRQQVTVIAIAGAERILKREVDAAKHKDVLDDLVGQV